MYLGSKLLGGGKHKNEGKGQEAPPRTVAPTSPAAVEDGDPQRVGTAMRLCSSCILEKLPFGVSDMEIWDSRLVLATSKGAVYIYAPLQSSVELTTYERLIRRMVPDKNAKPITKMAVILLGSKPSEQQQQQPTPTRRKAEFDMLLSLSEGTLTLSTLPHLESKENTGLERLASKLRGASTFCWSPSLSQLCVAVKRKLYLLSWDGHVFAEVKEVPVPDTPRVMEWTSSSGICLGMKREYLLLNTATGTLSEIMALGKSGLASIVPLPKVRGVLLAKDNIGMVVGLDGKVLRQHGLIWSEAPNAVVPSYPYVMGLLSSCVEARSVLNHEKVQTISIVGSQQAVGSALDTFVLTEDMSVYKITQLPLEEQISSLAAAGQYEEAIGLIDLLPKTKVVERTAMEIRLYKDFACDLFNEGNYDRAMHFFGLCNAHPVSVLLLFPEILPSTFDFKARFQHMEDAVIHSRSRPITGMPEEAGLALLSYLKDRRQAWMEPFANDRHDVVGESDPVPGIKLAVDERGLIWQTIDTSIAKVMSLLECRQAALYDFLGLSNSQVLLVEIVPYLKRFGLHRDLVQLYAKTQMHVDALKLICDLWENDPSKNLKAPATGWGFSEVSNPQSSDVLVEYLQDMPVIDRIENGHFMTMTRLSSAESGILTVHDLQPLPLMFEYAEKLVQEPTVLLQLFTEREDALDAETILQWLKRVCLSQAVPFLEIELSRDLAKPKQQLSADLHDELGLLYINAALQQTKQDVRNDIRNRLQLFLRSSTRYSPERLLASFKPQDLLEERAILLSRVNRHEQVLAIYLRCLGSLDKALAYCDRIYSSPPCAISSDTNTMKETGMQFQQPGTCSIQSPIYVTLVRVLLEPRCGMDFFSSSESGDDSTGIPADIVERMNARGDADMKDVFMILRDHSDRIDTLELIKAIPDSTKISVLARYLSKMFNVVHEQRRKSSVTRSLYQYNHLQVWEQHVSCIQRCVRVGDDDLCSICRKHISNSAFAVYPNDDRLVHYSCYVRSANGRASAEATPRGSAVDSPREENDIGPKGVQRGRALQSNGANEPRQEVDIPAPTRKSLLHKRTHSEPSGSSHMTDTANGEAPRTIRNIASGNGVPYV